MTNGQIAQFQELKKCYIPVRKKHGKGSRGYNSFVFYWGIQVASLFPEMPMNKGAKKILRRLTHLYRHQIAAMRKNRVSK